MELKIHLWIDKNKNSDILKILNVTLRNKQFSCFIVPVSDKARETASYSLSYFPVENPVSEAVWSTKVVGSICCRNTRVLFIEATLTR